MKRATLITVALINYPNKQQDFSAFITFSSQGSSCPLPTYLCFFSGKIPSHVAARLTRKYWVPNFRHFVTIPPPPPPLFATICYYSSLFATIRYSGFPDTLNDAPWVTAEFKALIKSRQKAFAKGDTERYRLLRNISNRERKLCCSKHYNNKVAKLRTTKLSQWWKEVKMIAGMAPTTGSDDIRSQLLLDGIADSSNLDIANLINTALWEPMQAYSPLACLPPAKD